jgi:hypothetical protein
MDGMTCVISAATASAPQILSFPVGPPAVPLPCLYITYMHHAKRRVGSVISGQTCTILPPEEEAKFLGGLTKTKSMFQGEDSKILRPANKR